MPEFQTAFLTLSHPVSFLLSSSETSAGSWWGGWLQAAKEKSLSAIDMIKKDLEEFSSTMSHDTGEAVAKTSESLRETLKVRLLLSNLDFLNSIVWIIGV